MNGFLVDTNVLSEVAKPGPDGNVVRWLDQSSSHNTYASVITLGELRLSIENFAPGKRRNQLETWLEVGVPNWFCYNLLPVSSEIAEQWGRLTIVAKRNGTPLSTSDGLIASTAIKHGLTLVTRNIRDFASLSIPLLNPWNT